MSAVPFRTSKSVLSILLIAATVVLFSLSAVMAAPFQFVVISDTHLNKDNQGPLVKEALAEIVKLHAAAPIKVMVMNGDMVFNHVKSPLNPDQYQAELEKYFQLVGNGLKGTDIKLLINRGNHDGSFNNDEPDAAHAPYIAKFKETLDKYKGLLASYDYQQLNSHIVLEGVSLVKLDFSADPATPANKVADLAWLKGIKKDLKARAFFFGHYPAFSSTSAGYAMGNSAAFLDTLAESANPRVYFSAHDHVFNHALLEKKDAGGKVLATVEQFNTPDMAAGTFSRDWAKKHFAKQPGDWTARIAGQDAYLDKIQGFYIVKVADQDTEVTLYKKTAAGYEKGYRAVVR